MKFQVFHLVKEAQRLPFILHDHHDLQPSNGDVASCLFFYKYITAYARLPGIRPGTSSEQLPGLQTYGSTLPSSATFFRTSSFNFSFLLLLVLLFFNPLTSIFFQTNPFHLPTFSFFKFFRFLLPLQLPSFFFYTLATK